MSQREKMADAICAMTYGELIDISNEMRDMLLDSPDIYRPNMNTDFGKLLYDWADAQAEKPPKKGKK